MPESTITATQAKQRLVLFSEEHAEHKGYDVGWEHWGFSLYCEACNEVEMLKVEGLRGAAGDELSEERSLTF